jgi:hypothetical protein
MAFVRVERRDDDQLQMRRQHVMRPNLNHARACSARVKARTVPKSRSWVNTT